MDYIAIFWVVTQTFARRQVVEAEDVLLGCAEAEFRVEVPGGQEEGRDEVGLEEGGGDAVAAGTEGRWRGRRWSWGAGVLVFGEGDGEGA